MKSKFSDNKTMLLNVNKNFNNKGYNFSDIGEMNTATIAIKMHMSYDFNIKNNMHAVEWKLIALIKKDKN